MVCMEVFKDIIFDSSIVDNLAISSAGTNIYFPHSKVLLLKRTNVRMFVLLGLFI